MNKCKSCDKELSKLKYNLCGSCAAKEKWESIKKPDKFCIDCGKKLSRKDASRCRLCSLKNRTRKPNYCIDCGKQITSNYSDNYYKRALLCQD